MSIVIISEGEGIALVGNALDRRSPLGIASTSASIFLEKFELLKYHSG